MPNWVTNDLTVSGDATTVIEIVKRLSRPYDTHYIEYKWDAETGQNTVIGNRTETRDQVLSFWNIKAPTDLDAYFGPEQDVPLDRALRKVTAPDGTVYSEWTEEFYAHMRESNHWYEWNNREWGTKWDACNPEISDDLSIEGSKASITYRFDTAWSPAMPALLVLSEQYPTVTLRLSWDEEQGFGQELTITDGEVEVLREWDIPSTHAEEVERNGSCYCTAEADPEFWPFADCTGVAEEVSA